MHFHCLVVDDNEGFLEVARRTLERQGLPAVATATTIAAALEAAADGRPDVVLVDISLGAESGFDLVHLLADRLPHLIGRIIMISTRTEEDYADLLDDPAIAGFLDKPALSVTAIHSLVPDLS